MARNQHTGDELHSWFEILKNSFAVNLINLVKHFLFKVGCGSWIGSMGSFDRFLERASCHRVLGGGH